MTDKVNVSERRIEVGDLRFNVAEAGSGAPVILLHGWPDSWHLWHHQIEALTRSGHRVIAPDLRGFGESDRPDDVAQYGLLDIVGDVTGILDALDVERAAVVGHDWGSAVAWLLASFVPDRVDRLVAVSVGHPGAFASADLAQRQLSWYMMWFQFPGVAEVGLAEDDWFFFRRWAHGGVERGEDPYVERQIADLSRPGALTAGFNWYRSNIDPATFHRNRSNFDFPQVQCPTMGVWSTGDMALGERQMIDSKRFVDGPWLDSGARTRAVESTLG
jgi:pimeloyl-ACP methyl ester carboxylesterase